MQIIEFGFSPKQTISHLIATIKTNIESLHYGLRLIESEIDMPERLKNDNDFFHIQIGEPLPKSEIRRNLREMLLSKYFEDLIKGITLSLCDVYTLIKFRLFLHDALISASEEVTPSILIEITAKHGKIYKKAQGMPLPKLLEEISASVSNELVFTKEIKSINNARNCFVHRKGIVYPEKDINNTENNTLTVHWVKQSLYQEKDGQKTEMINGGVVTHEYPAFFERIQYKKSFEPYEVIVFNYKEIVDITYTCYLFGESLVNAQIQFLKENKLG